MLKTKMSAVEAEDLCVSLELTASILAKEGKARYFAPKHPTRVSLPSGGSVTLPAAPPGARRDGARLIEWAQEATRLAGLGAAILHSANDICLAAELLAEGRKYLLKGLDVEPG